MIQTLVVTANHHTREQLATLLHKEIDIHLLDETIGGQALFATTGHKIPDVALIDLELPDRAGWPVSRQLQTTYPGIKILVLCLSVDEAIFSDLLSNGVLGCLTYSCTGTELQTAIRAAYRGSHYLCAEAQELLIKGCLARI